MVERVIANALKDGVSKNLNYKDIYKLAATKARQVYSIVAS